MWRQWIQSPVRQGGEKSSGQNAPETQRIRTEYAHKINLLSQLLWCFHELAKGICKSNGTEVYLCFIDMISLEVKILISFTENVHNDGTLPRGFRQEVLKLVWDRGQMSYWVVKKKKKKIFHISFTCPPSYIIHAEPIFSALIWGHMERLQFFSSHTENMPYYRSELKLWFYRRI